MHFQDNPEVFQKFATMPCHPEQSSEGVSEYLVSFFQSLGLSAQSQAVIHSYDTIAKRQFNVLGILGDKLVDRTTPKGLLFTAPYDSLQPAHSLVKSRLGLWCALEAAQKFREKPLKQPVYFAATCGSNIHHLGTRYLISSKSLFPNYVLVTTPTENRIEVSNKALYRTSLVLEQAATRKDSRGFSRGLKLTCRGVSASSAYPKAGVNAIHELMDFLLNSLDQGFELKIESITGGGRYCLIPDHAEATFYLTPHQFEDYRRTFEEMLATDPEKAQMLSLEPIQGTPHIFMEEELRHCAEEIRLKLQMTALQLAKVKDEQFSPASPTLVLTDLQAAGSHVKMKFDLRSLPDQNSEELQRSLHQEIKNAAQKYPKLNLKIQKEPSLNAYKFLKSEYLDIAKDLSLEAHIQSENEYNSEANEVSLFKQSNYKTLGFGPFHSLKPLNADRPDFVEAMRQAILFYELMIERFCL